MVSHGPGLDDFDVVGAEFAKIANECCQRHSLAFAVGAFVQQKRLPDFAVLEELGGEMFATKACTVDETDHPLDFLCVLVVRETGERWIGWRIEWPLCDGVDFFDGSEQHRGWSGWSSIEDWSEFFLGFENVLDCKSAVIVFHFLLVDVNEGQNVFDGPAFAVLVFGDEVGDFNS